MIPAKSEHEAAVGAAPPASIFDEGGMSPPAAAAPVAVPVGTAAPVAVPVAPQEGSAAAQPVMVQAVAVPKLPRGRGPHSREAIVIGMANNPQTWQVRMADAPCEETGCWLAGCCCPHLAAYHMRQKFLGERFKEDYSCCQMESIGYKGGCSSCCSCFKSCPEVGNCLEACCCPNLSLSFTRIHAMKQWQIRPDPVDYQCIQFVNCMIMPRCFCDIAEMFNPAFKEAAQCLDIATDCAWHMILGCMTAQINAEIGYRTAAQGSVAHATPMPGAPAATPILSPARSDGDGGKGGLKDGLLSGGAANTMER